MDLIERLGGARPGLRRPPGAGRIQPDAGSASGAESVKQFLVELGVPETAIRLMTMGQDGALCEEPGKECQQLNRRVHLEFRKLAAAAPAGPTVAARVPPRRHSPRRHRPRVAG